MNYFDQSLLSEFPLLRFSLVVYYDLYQHDRSLQTPTIDHYLLCILLTSMFKHLMLFIMLSGPVTAGHQHKAAQCH